MKRKIFLFLLKIYFVYHTLMKELIIGDLHFGIKNNSLSWLELQIEFFNKQIIPTLEEGNFDRCIFLGDITDIRYSINQQVGIEVKNIFRNLLNQFPNIHFIIVAGNHDYYSPLEEFAIYNSYELMFGEEFLQIHKNLTVVSNEPYITEDGALFLPWYWTDNDSHIDEILYNYNFNEEVKEIFCHTDLSAWPGARIAAFKGVPIYSGHIHYEYMDPTANLYNIGSACSFTFNDVNMDKYLYVLENYRIVDRIKNYVTPKFIRLYNDEIFEVTDEKFNNSYVQLCISSNNIKKAKYVEQINNLKTTYINSNIRLHIIDEDTNLTTLSVASFNSNIESYIESNIPAYLNDKYTFIKNKINQV